MAKNEVVAAFLVGDITAETALMHLGKAIQVAKASGRSTKVLEEAVTEVLGIAEEPPVEDLERLTSWEASKSEN